MSASQIVSSPLGITSESPPTHSTTGPALNYREDILSVARKGFLDSAFQMTQRALGADFNDVFALCMMAKLSLDAKRSSELFKKVIQLRGASPEAEESFFRLGQYYYASGKYHQAIPYFRDYLKLFPTGNWHEPARYWMGNACLAYAQSKPDKISYLDSAFAYFEQLGDTKKPDEYYFPLAMEGLAKAKIAKGDRDGAMDAVQGAIAKAPEEEQASLLLLSAQLWQGFNREKEKEAIQKLVKRYPQSPEIRYLTKLNSGAEKERWKSGNGLPKPLIPVIKDSTLTEATPSVSNTQTKEFSELEKGFTLQLGGFSQPANAKTMIENLMKLGLAPELIESSRNGKKFFQVRLGKFKTLDEANEYSKSVLKPQHLLSQPMPFGP